MCMSFCVSAAEHEGGRQGERDQQSKGGARALGDTPVRG